MLKKFLASPSKAVAAFNFLSHYRNAFYQYILHKSFNEISRRNGWQLNTDGIHLKSRGGRTLVDLVQEFIAS